VIFGDIVKVENETEIEVHAEQHTEARLSWPQAKVAALLFAVNIAAQEEKDGPIKIPPDVIPYLIDNSERALPLVEMVKLIIQRREDALKNAAPSPALGKS
jgi:hypothetical protein